ncbi:ABC transporter substrate-binding protein [Bradyrhizobium sp. JYMT SZCCT0428]|uniref:ABC transporter substrate-binding protein n=1 Tax=Bradyrhizobium sp. JYMT SZCCT0428 TaxID=2807673 RepID=UPI001BAD737E|nr:ABC transporter substrate-binding protein [Bradyrhizobium sp. JYMT SZCCT0428]MBR1152494.1 ABC transporter substrate-binding protein [Bradyrhizobium sp. JYMT SZCCT0428]
MSLVTATAIWPIAAIAQSKAIAKIAIIGSLNQTAINVFKDGLREFGFVEGETIIILGSPASAASPEEVSKSVSNFISQKIDLIFASGAVAGRTAKAATSTLPIVCLTGDLVGAGLVQSLASPGGNITGISILTAEASAKRLELLKLLIPGLERVAAFYNVADPTAGLSLKPTEAAAKELQLTVEALGVRGESDFRNAFAAAIAARAQAIALTSNPLFDIAGSQIAELALQNKLATISFADSFPKVGGLVSYGPNIMGSYRRAAYFVSRILRGDKPENLPVEQPAKYNLGINLNTARALDISVPKGLLAFADEVIE